MPELDHISNHECVSISIDKKRSEEYKKAKTHQWDIKSKIFNILPVQLIYLATLCS